MCHTTISVVTVTADDPVAERAFDPWSQWQQEQLLTKKVPETTTTTLHD